MKKLFVVFACLTFWKVSSLAQTTNIEINELTSPALPAFVIMDISPDQISRPTTMKALTTSLQQAVGKTGFADDIALEFSPFWLKGGEKDFYQYYGYKNKADVLKNSAPRSKNIFETLSFSIGTSGYELNDSIKGKKLGIGIRTQLCSGKPTEKLKEIIKTRLIFPSEIRAIANNLIDRLEEDTNSIKSSNSIQSAAMALIELNNHLDNNAKVELKALADSIFLTHLNGLYSNQAINELKKINTSYGTDNVQSFIEEAEEVPQRVGLILETAAAALLDFPTNDFGLSYGRKIAAWVTLNYRMPKRTSNDFTVLLRLAKDGIDLKTNSLDAGGKYSYSQKNFSLGGEFLFRYSSEKEKIIFNGIEGLFVTSNSGYRFSFNGQYRLSEFIILNATFGKDYDTKLTSGELVAQIGANFSLFQKQLLRF